MPLSNFLKYFSILTPVLFINIAYADIVDLGQSGDVFEITEKDMREWIKEKSKTLDMAKFQADLTGKVKKYKPQGVKLDKADKNVTHYYNPEIILTEPLLDHKGNILVPAGHRDNPLNYIPFTQTLVFFDATENKQVEFALHIEGSKENVILIETDGDVFDDIKKYSKRIFFANNSLIDKLGINKVPSIVYQEGMLLRIDEVKVD